MSSLETMKKIFSTKFATRHLQNLCEDSLTGGAVMPLVTDLQHVCRKFFNFLPWSC